MTISLLQLLLFTISTTSPALFKFLHPMMIRAPRDAISIADARPVPVVPPGKEKRQYMCWCYIYYTVCGTINVIYSLSHERCKTQHQIFFFFFWEGGGTCLLKSMNGRTWKSSSIKASLLDQFRSSHVGVGNLFTYEYKGCLQVTLIANKSAWSCYGRLKVPWMTNVTIIQQWATFTFTVKTSTGP